MEDKIDRLLEAIKPTNSHFSELVISQLVDQIIESNPQRVRLLIEDIDSRLNGYLCTILNSSIKESNPLARHWNDIKDRCFLRFNMEFSRYEYDYLSQRWEKEEATITIPYIDNTGNSLASIEPFNDEWTLFMFLSQDKTYIPYDSLFSFLYWKWELFRQRTPSLSELDACYKSKEMLQLHPPYEVCIYYLGKASVRGHDIMTNRMKEIIKQSGRQPEIHSRVTDQERFNRNFSKYISTSRVKSLIKELHKLIDGRTGRKSTLPIYVGVEMKLMLKPSYKDFISEFDKVISESEYSKVFNAPKFTDDEIRDMKLKLYGFKQ